MGYYAKYLSKLKAVCDKKRLKLREIGKVNDMPIYKIVINPTAKKTVVFSAGIHGEEIAGPWAIPAFLEQFNPEDYPDLKVVIFPVASPTAFDLQRRFNFHDWDPNWLFCEKRLKEEPKILFGAVKKEDVFFFHALHEDVEVDSFYLYNFENKEEPIYRDILKMAGKHFNIMMSDIIFGDPAVNGLVINRWDNTFEDRMFKEGVPYSMCSETPGLLPLDKRVTCNVEIMNQVMEFTKQNAVLSCAPSQSVTSRTAGKVMASSAMPGDMLQ